MSCDTIVRDIPVTPFFAEKFCFASPKRLESDCFKAAFAEVTWEDKG